MRLLRLSKSLLALSVAVVSVTPFAAAQSASLGRGLEQMVEMSEFSSPNLPQVLQQHLISPAGDPLVQIHLQPGITSEFVLPLLQMTGFQLQAVSKLNPSLLEGYLPLSSARTAAGVIGVQHISAVHRPLHFAAQVGSVPSQAVPAEHADLAQDRRINGTGTKIGILSDSFDSFGHHVDKNGNPAPIHPDAADDEATGDLPPTVTVLQDIAGATDEGRAMAQLAHKIAPGAAEGFATADGGEVTFSNNILALREEFGADVICDDVVYLAEPMFSDGIIAQAVDKAVSEGAAYFSSAGNNGLEAFQDTYRPMSISNAEKLVTEGKENVNIPQLLAGLASLGVSPPQSLHTFINPDGTTSITQKFTSVNALNQISFQWDEPFLLGKTKTNFDVYIFDSAGNWLNPVTAPTVFYTLDDNLQTDEPFEFLELIPNGFITGGLDEGQYQFVIGNVNNGPARNIKYVAVNTVGESQRQNAPSIFGHTAARNGQSVAAQFWAIPKFPEDFSSPGPVTIFFDDQGNRLRFPEVRDVPQITAIDGVDTTFFGRFFGTSAAAPDAAAVGALVIQASGGPGSIEPQDVYREMQKTASAIPLSRIRNLSGTFVGPVVAAANGDDTRFQQYFNVGALDSRHSVQSVSFDATPTGLIFNPAANRFHLGTTSGISASNITPSYSPDSETLTLNFAPGTFHAGSFFTFGASIFNPVQGSVGEDGDRMEGMLFTVTLDNGTTSTGKFVAAPQKPVNRFTGFGLVNADAATQHAKKEHREK
jgi:hypothetical protein